MHNQVSHTHRQQHVVADLDSAPCAHRPAVDYLGPHVSQYSLGPGEDLPCLRPHHEGQGASGRGIYSA